MTGTALTEANEFMKIYKLSVVAIPTNRPMVRADRNDQIYKTKDGKWAAVESEIAERHEAGQPVLVGTISVEVSELLSRRLERRGIPHAVLNAKPEFAQREGETVAEAGRPGAVTIATNMAGRGVDIKLGGNEEHLTQLEVAKLGLKPGDPDYDDALRADPAHGRRRASRRTARRSTRPAACSSSAPSATSRAASTTSSAAAPAARATRASRASSCRAEDDLVRLFAGDRIYRILDRFKVVDDEGNEEPIEAGILSKQIENAQRKVEEQHFLQRKHTLEYDDVMNQQREVVYRYRDDVLEGRDMGQVAREEIAKVIGRLVDEYTTTDYFEDWDLNELWGQLDQIFQVDFGPDDLDPASTDREELKNLLTDDAHKLYDERETELGEELMRALERFLLLQIIDERWREHLYDMDYLREGIHLRGFAQIEPIVAYKNEAFTLFEDMMNAIWQTFARMVYNVEVSVEDEETLQQHQAASGGAALEYSAPTFDPGFAEESAELEGGAPEPVVTQRTLDENEQLGRNDPCWCGSGKKFKKCHGA